MTVAIPESPEQLEEAFHDEARMQSIFAEGNFGRFTHAYMKAFTGKSKEDIAAFKAEMQKDFADFMRVQAEKGAVPAAAAPAAARGPRRAQAAARYRGSLAGAADAAEFFDRQGLFSRNAPGAHEGIDNSEYSSDLRQFVWAVIKGEAVAKKDGNAELLDRLVTLKGSLARALEVKNAAAMSERVPSEGGFLVPENLRSEILSLSLENEVVRPEATIVSMDSLTVPFPSIDDTSHSNSVFGGVSAGWAAEGASVAALSSAPKFSRVKLTANKLVAWTKIPNELLQDSSTSADAWFRTFFPLATAFFADAAFLRGSGVDEPEGLLECPGAVTVDPATTGKIAIGDVLGMLVRLWPPSLKRARWACSPDAFGQLLQMGLISGATTTPPLMLGGYQAIELPADLQKDGFHFRMLGITGRVTEKMPYPGSGTDGSLTLYDPSGYLIGDRQAMQIASSAEFSFDTDEIAYRITQRMDGRGWQRTPLTPYNGGSTLSMIVKLGDTHV